MSVRDIVMAAAGAAGGLALGVMPFWDGQDAPAPAAAPTQTASPDGAPAAPRDAAGRALARAQPDAPANADDPDAPASAPRAVLYGPDGERPCDDACVAGLAEGLLSGTVDEDAQHDIYNALPAIAEDIAADAGLRRRFLGLLGGIEAGEYGPSDTQDQMLLSLATFYELPDDLARDVATRLGRSPYPAIRAAALNVTMMRDDPDASRIAVEDALVRERDGEALVMALGYVPAVADTLSPSTLAAVRTMARRHDDADVRGAAMNAVMWQMEDAERQRFLQGALGDASPMVRLSAISGLVGYGDETVSERDAERYRAMTEAIANDQAAAPAARMEALSMLAYGAFSDGEDETYWDHGHY